MEGPFRLKLSGGCLYCLCYGSANKAGQRMLQQTMVIVSVLAVMVAGKPVHAIDCQQFIVLQILGITGLQPPYGF